MICFAKRGLVCVVHKEEFSITCSICDRNSSSRQRRCCIRTTASRVQLPKKISGHEPQAAWSQDELIGSKSPVVTKLSLAQRKHRFQQFFYYFLLTDLVAIAHIFDDAMHCSIFAAPLPSNGWRLLLTYAIMSQYDVVCVCVCVCVYIYIYIYITASYECAKTPLHVRKRRSVNALQSRGESTLN
jgi:hypothetical protein